MRAEHPAPPALRAYVRCLWSVERTFTPPADTFDLLPDRYVELVFTADARFTVADAAAPRELPRAYVVGLLDGPVRLRARGTVRAVAARCDAWNVAPLLVSVLDGPLGGGVRALHPAHAPLADAIAARLDAGDVGAALGLLQEFLLALAAGLPPVPAAVRRAGRALGGAAGGGGVGAAAAAAGRTPRQLERQFRARAGVTPKGYARRARFERARDRLWAAPATGLAALAAECGYADQAHLTREFTTFAGEPPRRWAARVVRARALLDAAAAARGAPDEGSPAPDVAFLQDG
ncbi:hypothetical protein tb265_43130 [Gemmatimonadetes bacterium T265]|nr:hypothetical protein tb265_43130 [Gemmatimonadetes bacterium T265]